MKKVITLSIDYAGGESRYSNLGCDYMIVNLPDDARHDEIYVEIDPADVDGAGHYEGTDWVWDDEMASEPVLYKMLAERAEELGYTVVKCGDDPAAESGRGITLYYDVDDDRDDGD